jgi:hypothetical protein
MDGAEGGVGLSWLVNSEVAERLILLEIEQSMVRFTAQD